MSAYGTGSDPVAFGYLLPPQSFISDRVILVSVTLQAINQSSVQTTQTGCLQWIDSDMQRFAIGTPDDKDCDGYTVQDGDCNDEDPLINPGATEVCGNGIDDNCNGVIDESTDNDHDGVTNCQGDCNDNDPDISPNLTEAQFGCDGKDNDCNGVCDDIYDVDGDNYTTCGTLILGNAGPGHEGKCMTGVTPDCNDNVAAIHPGAVEICDGKDNDCSGKCDDLAAFDPDGDGFTTCNTIAGEAWGAVPGICGAPVSALADCGETTASQHPFAHELCDGLDDNCDTKGETSEYCYHHVDAPLVDAGPLAPDASLALMDAGPAATGCLVGRRSCTEGFNGSFTLGTSCASIDDPLLSRIAVDDSLCTDYTTAPCATNEEPYRCVNDNNALATYVCNLTYLHVSGNALTGVPSSFTLCGGVTSSTALPVMSGATTCEWTLVGDINQEQYIGGLAATETGPVLPVSASCDVFFEITQARNTFGPQTDQFVFGYGDNQTSPRKPIVFRITPVAVTTCSDPALACVKSN